ncbi:MAG: acyl-CoA dehydrogenase family protein [Pseudomonadota bacterium]
MNFDFTEEQRVFRDSARRFLHDSYTFEKRQSIVHDDAPFCAETWRACADLGWLCLPFSEQHGGLGGDILDTVILFEELGRQLVIEPFLETLILAGGVLRRCPVASTEGLLGALMEGQLQGAFAHGEISQRNFNGVRYARAEESPQGFRLRGKKVVVHNALAADVIIVSASLGGGSELGLFLVRPGDTGVGLHGYPTIDGRAAGDITLNDVEVPTNRLLARGPTAEIVLEQVHGEALLALSADMIGSMDTLIDRTIEYTKERRQFGSRLVDFQVLRHRMVDMFVAKELATSLCYAAATKARDGATDARRFAAAAKAKADKSAKLVAHAAIQLHGGIATTDELAIGHHLKRITVHEQRFGSTQDQLKAFRHLAGSDTALPSSIKKVA